MDTIQFILNGMMREALSPQTAAVAIAVIGLNIHFGFTGLINIGQSAFMLLGAYGFAISVWHGLPMVVGLALGFGAAFVFALILGAPTLKLRGDYLAIVTISAAEIIRYVGRSALLTDFTGSAQGIPGSQYRDPFTSLSFFGGGQFTLLPFNYTDVADGAAWVRIIGWVLVVACAVALILRLRRGHAFAGLGQAALMGGLIIVGVFLLFFLFPVPNQRTGVNGWWVRFIAWGLVLLCTLVVYLLVRSPWGRLLRGIREDEDAIRSLGKNVFSIKMQALIIGGLFGALGGIVYVLPASVQPDSMGRSLTFFCYTALLLGGAATIFGPLLGSILFFAARIGIKYTAAAYVPDSIMNNQQTEQFSYIVVGVALMLIVIFRPQGILGNKRELRFNV
ncbi:branched-chain amino acid ABC transporter permease [Nocardioides sp. LMS-CY]|uniref:branched-chain amino acid ABC transporter permease n=1 Tax=Nocardioides sp. (strain LMS-CY) TaxID=2840457 RepID=UPI001C007808|nr:branched-chain amino acid ABC transporter permease [Nocardioides sp. LMS-CY]QWF24224.1 branched-chain amino acid ABC transporter permease [Nocardioides sp. LMS-CY]